MKRLLPLGLILLTACFDTPADPPPPPPPPPDHELTPDPELEVSIGEQAGAIAKELQANPAGAAEILKGHGMTQAEFEALLVKVAADAAQSKTYAEILGG